MLEHEFLLLSEEQTRTVRERLAGTAELSAAWDRSGLVLPELTAGQERARETVLSVLDRAYGERRKEAVRVRDSLILPRLERFRAVDTLLDGWLPYKGLNYYGFTGIPAESVPALEAVLRELARGEEFAPLLALCREARAAQVWLLHCGI